MNGPRDASGLLIIAACVAAAGCGERTESDTGSKDAPTFVLSADTLFDSAARTDEAISVLGSVWAAMFLTEDRLVVQDGASFHLVELSTGGVETVGGEGMGPCEFQGPFQAVRSGDGFAVWDLVLGRLTNLSSDGTCTGSRGFDIGQLQSPMAPLVAAFSDGSMVFRDDSASAFDPDASPQGVHRAPLRYRRFPRDGEGVVVRRATGPATIHEDPLYMEIVFAHQVIEAALGDTLVVAQTDRPTIDALAPDGSVAWRLPMPEPIDVSAEQIEMARARAIEAERRQVARRSGSPLGGAAEAVGPPADVPANDPAPPIDGMFAGVDGRVWVRRYRVKDGDGERWQAWDADDATPGIRLWIREGEGSLLDVAGDKALLHVEDDLGVDRVLVRRIDSRSSTDR